MKASFDQLASIDFKMLNTLITLMETKNVSKAAELLGVQQSTVSYQLGKLREALNDPLLIRSGRGLEPSPYALQLLPDLNAQLQMLQELLFNSRFNPVEATGTIKIACHRNGAQTFIRRLLSQVNQNVPNIRLDIVDWSDQVIEQLRDSRLDFAIGFAPENSPQIEKQPLIDVSYQVVMDISHPYQNKRLDDRIIFDYPHVVVNTHEAVERWLNYLAQKYNKQRIIGFSSASMEFATMSLNDTDRLMFVANTQNDFFESYDVKVKPAPFIPSQTISLLFHERASIDPLRSYIKSMIEMVSSTLFEGETNK